MHKLLTAATLGLFAAAPLLAQERELEEVVVTAEFRNIPLLRQAVSTTVLTSADIEQRAAQHLEDMLGSAPNVNFASGASRARFYQIRGVGERSQFVEPLNPSIGFVIDGVDFSGLGTAGNLYDVAQVEILRGPQGTLHGANALAGLINVRSNPPEAEPGLQVEGMLGDFNSWSAGITATGPLIADSLLYRMAVHSYQSDGFIENEFLDRDDTNNRDETSLRGKLRWLTSDTATLDLAIMHFDVDNGYDAFSLDNTRETLSDQPGQDRQKSTALALDWRQQYDHLDLQVLMSWATTETDYGFDEDWSYRGIAPGWEYSSFDRYRRDRDSASAELRLLSNEHSRVFGGRGQWVAGLYYLGDREDLRRDYTYLDDVFFSRYDTDTLAVFGQLDTILSSALTLIAGLRLEQRGTDYRDSNAVAADPDENHWGGRLVLQYEVSELAMLYGGVSRGYRANGVNAGVLASMRVTDDPGSLDRLGRLQEFDAEYLVNWETGVKADFLDKRLQTRLALFYMDRQDQQVKGSLVIPRPDGSTAFIDYTSNAAEGDNYGLELELDWLALDDLQLYASIGLLETEFQDYVNADGVDLSGREQAHAPGYQYALGGRYDFGRGFYLRLDLEGKDDYFFSDRHEVKSPAYDLVHLRLGFDAAQWSLALWGRNLTDEDYFVRGFGSFGNDPRKEYVTEPYYQYGEPRMLGISASYRF